MKLREKLHTLNYLVKAKIYKKVNYPLVIRWNITNKCCFSCIYCDFHNLSSRDNRKELNTEESLTLIKQIAHCGVRRIGFSGGEPMLREDLGILISLCKDLNISTESNSSGKYIPERIKEIKPLSLIKLSLDGPSGVQELIRRGTTFNEVINAAEACLKNNIKFTFCTTLTKLNIDSKSIRAVLDIAKNYNTIVAFQPLGSIPQSSPNVKDCYPDRAQFQSAVRMLINEKMRGNKNIRNSVNALKFVLNWPEYPALSCYAGKVFCIIDPDGTILPCDRITYNLELSNIRNLGFKNAFTNMPDIKSCKGCGFCGTIELNALMSLSLRRIGPIYKFA